MIKQLTDRDCINLSELAYQNLMDLLEVKYERFLGAVLVMAELLVDGKSALLLFFYIYLYNLISERFFCSFDNCLN
ncbi:MAG: hypothetical protein GY756_08145 [bacterium]|nr:hypothetical protein [bacterium]